MRYCSERKLAFLQICPTTVQNMVARYVLAAECGIEMNHCFFEEITTQKPILVYPGHSTENPTMVEEWDRSYFFVRVNKAFGLNRNKVYRTDWNFFPGSLLVARFKCLFGYWYINPFVSCLRSSPYWSQVSI